LFSIRAERGISVMIVRKYMMDAVWPIVMKGYSTGWPPIHVSVNRSATRVQNRIWVMGRNPMLCCFDRWRVGIIIRIRMESTRARTPPSLLGIDRRIAYANRKYHSGLMWGGVLRGLASV